LIHLTQREESKAYKYICYAENESGYEVLTKTEMEGKKNCKKIPLFHICEISKKILNKMTKKITSCLVDRISCLKRM